MIQCQNIHLSFKNKVVFSDLNILIGEHQNVCISAPSGVGKSSLLKLLQGYLFPDQGEIRIRGLLLNEKNIQQIRKWITWIPQNIYLPVDNGLDLMKLMEVTAIQTKAEAYLEQLGLEKSILSKDFSQISGGEKQRTIVAICLSLDHDIIMMDEPTSSLDEESIQLLIQCIQSLKGKTILSASHNASWMKSADQIIKL